MADDIQDPEEDEEDDGFDADHPNDSAPEVEEEVAPETEATAESEPEEEAPPAFSLREYATKAGLQIGEMQDEELAGALLNQSRQQADELNQLRQLAAWGRQFQQHYPQFQTYLQSQQQPAPVATKEPKWKAVEYSPDWESMVKQDENGNWVPVGAHVAPNLPEKYVAAKKWQRETLLNLLQKPEETLWPLFEDKVKEVAQGLVQQQLGGYHQTQSMTSFLQGPQSEWMFNKDANGNRGGLNDLGFRFAQITNELQADGITDPERQRIRAMQILRNEVAPAEPAQTPAQIRDETNGRFLKAARQPNRGGVAGREARKSRQKVTSSNFDEVLRNRLKANGISMDDKPVRA